MSDILDIMFSDYMFAWESTNLIESAKSPLI